MYPRISVDGDTVSCSLTIDNHIERLMKPLESHNNVFVLNKPWEVSNNISIPKPVVATISNWIQTEEVVTQDMVSRFNALPWVE